MITNRHMAWMTFACLQVWWINVFFPNTILKIILSFGVGGSMAHLLLIYKGMLK